MNQESINYIVGKLSKEIEGIDQKLLILMTSININESNLLIYINVVMDSRSRIQQMLHVLERIRDIPAYHVGLDISDVIKLIEIVKISLSAIDGSKLSVPAYV